MSDHGKISREFFREHIYPHLGADRDDVALGPTHGVDFGVVTVDDSAVVTATDPVSVLPALGYERAARFALDIVLSDVAVSGIPPSHLSISFTLPRSMGDEEFATVWETIDEEATELGVSIVTGHTGRYADCSFPWIGGATAFAVGDPDKIIRPDGARPGDQVLITNGPAVETTGLLTSLFPDGFDLPAETIATAQERLEDARGVRDALTAASAGPVTAMHDATECGIFGALSEMSESAGVGLEIDTSRVPRRPGVTEVCDALEIDPWTATTAGSLLITVAPDGVDAVRQALEDRGTAVGVAGHVTAGNEVRVDGTPIQHPTVDPAWGAYERLASAAEQSE